MSLALNAFDAIQSAIQSWMQSDLKSSQPKPKTTDWPYSSRYNCIAIFHLKKFEIVERIILQRLSGDRIEDSPGDQ